MSTAGSGLGERLELPRSGLRVSRFCLGLVPDPEVVLAAYAAGINFFFVSADMHWPLYEGTRRGLERLLGEGVASREQIVVAVVSYVTQPEFCQAPFEEALEAIPGLGHVDLGVIGGSYASDFFVRLAEYERHRPAGMRGLGATFHQRASAVTAIEHELLDVAFVRYNAAHPGAEHDVFPHLREPRRTLLYNFKSMGGYVPPERLAALRLPEENWRPRPTDHYRFALRRPEIDGILGSFERPEQVTELARELGQEPLTEDEAEYLKLLAGLDAGTIELAADPNSSGGA